MVQLTSTGKNNELRTISEVNLLSGPENITFIHEKFTYTIFKRIFLFISCRYDFQIQISHFIKYFYEFTVLSQ